ncbi:MAG: peptide chain release factor N(5)-glutamine methyltransferase [Thiogranum sp.]|nr:peptide chain release factor N(5)-glutamine methyltransferase [Thiogranum sp.]
MTSVGAALQAAVQSLHQQDQPRLDAEVLLAHVLQKPRSYLRAWPEADLDGDQAARYAELIRRRVEGHPVAYLTGHREFWSLDFEVSPATLIPRPETELLVEQALTLLSSEEALAIADLGTGSGAIAVALAHQCPRWHLFAVDQSPDSLKIAQRNAARHAAANVSLINADWCAAFAPASLDAIVANPPYVPNRDPHLKRGDLRFEPISALAAGPDGLDDLSIIIMQSSRILKKDGLLLLEHAPEQTATLHKHLNRNGFSGIYTLQDSAGLERVTVARKST